MGTFARYALAAVASAPAPLAAARMEGTGDAAGALAALAVAALAALAALGALAASWRRGR